MYRPLDLIVVRIYPTSHNWRKHPDRTDVLRLTGFTPMATKRRRKLHQNECVVRSCVDGPFRSAVLNRNKPAKASYNMADLSQGTCRARMRRELYRLFVLDRNNRLFAQNLRCLNPLHVCCAGKTKRSLKQDSDVRILPICALKSTSITMLRSVPCDRKW